LRPLGWQKNFFDVGDQERPEGLRRGVEAPWAWLEHWLEIREVAVKDAFSAVIKASDA